MCLENTEYLSFRSNFTLNLPVRRASFLCFCLGKWPLQWTRPEERLLPSVQDGCWVAKAQFDNLVLLLYMCTPPAGCCQGGPHLHSRGRKNKKRKGRLTEWVTLRVGQTTCDAKAVAAGDHDCVCTGGEIEVEGRVELLFYQVFRAQWGHSLLLPVVEDGCVALVVQFHVRGENLISLRLKEKWGADSYFPLFV